MDNETQKFTDTLRTVSLSSEERALLRNSLIKKIRATCPTPSPWSWLLQVRQAEIAVLALVIVGGYGGTISLVAEGSLPGDTLYSVKTHVTEPLVRLVTVTTLLDQANFETSLLEKRLVEAEELNGKLDTDPTLKQVVREVVRAQSTKTKSRVARIEPAASEATAPATMSLRAMMPLEEATSTMQGFAREAKHSDDMRPDREGDVENEDAHRSKRALKGVYEKHKRILKRLELEEEGVRD